LYLVKEAINYNILTMKDNNRKLETKERAPVWRVKIGIHSEISEDRIYVFRELKRWKMDIILN